MTRRWRGRATSRRWRPPRRTPFCANAAGRDRGRLPAQRLVRRVEGHRAGIDSVRDVVETSARLGIGVLTLYAFSIENWKRPRTEVNTLMTLLKRYLRSELETLLRNNIRFHVIGRKEELPPDVQDELEAGIRRTATK